MSFLLNPYRHLFIVKSVLDVFRHESSLVGFKETGGGLLGYISKDKATVVTHACGPGPKAILTVKKVILDGQFIQEFADKMYEQSNYLFDYIGDWHRHLGYSLTPSTKDIIAMKLAAGHPGMLENPISIIYRSGTFFKTELLKAYVYVNQELRPISYTIIDNVPK